MICDKAYCPDCSYSSDIIVCRRCDWKVCGSCVNAFQTNKNNRFCKFCKQWFCSRCIENCGQVCVKCEGFICDQKSNDPLSNCQMIGKCNESQCDNVVCGMCDGRICYNCSTKYCSVCIFINGESELINEGCKKCGMFTCNKCDQSLFRGCCSNCTKLYWYYGHRDVLRSIKRWYIENNEINAKAIRDKIIAQYNGLSHECLKYDSVLTKTLAIIGLKQ